MNHLLCQSFDLRNTVFMELLDNMILWRASEFNRRSNKDGECSIMMIFIICPLTIYRAIKLRVGHVGHRGSEKCK
jgi:hypothetical protein